MFRFTAFALLAAVVFTSSSAVAQYGYGNGSRYQNGSRNSGYTQTRTRMRSAVASTPAVALKKHINSSGQFEALMPSGTSSVTVEGKTLMDTQWVARGSAQGANFKLTVQIISVFQLDDEMTTALRDNYIKQAREQGEKAFGRASSDKEVTQHGMKGREFLYRIPASRSSSGKAVAFRQRVMFDGQRLYNATLSGDTDTVTSDSGTKYMSSVKFRKRRG